MSAREDLVEWLSRHDYSLYEKLTKSADPAADVRALNAKTGLRLPPQIALSLEGRERLCAQYLRELKKGSPMAMSIDVYKQQNQHRVREMQWEMEEKISAVEQRILSERANSTPVQPVQPPEPNKVLLLLGEEA